MVRLQMLRKDAKISQQKLADAIGVSRSTIAMWESAASQPDNQLLQSLADYFDVSVDYLLGRTDEKSPGQSNSPELDMDSIEYALYGTARELDEDEKQQLLELAKLMRKKRKESAE